MLSWPTATAGRSAPSLWRRSELHRHGPVRSAMLAGSVGSADLGKAVGFHEALDTAGALLGPAVALLLLATGGTFRTVFWVALIPGVVCVVLFAVLTRDPRHQRADPVSLRVPMPKGFWRLMAPVG